MSANEAAVHRLLAALSPVRHPGTYVFACLDADTAIAHNNAATSSPALVTTICSCPK